MKRLLRFRSRMRLRLPPPVIASWQSLFSNTDEKVKLRVKTGQFACAIAESAGARFVANPPLSVVVVALIGREALANCLDRLPLDAIECVVVLTKEMRSSSPWERRYPSVVFVEAPDEPVPLRRH